MRQPFVQAGIASGVIASVVSGFMMQIMLTPILDGGRMSLMTIVALASGSDAPWLGWGMHLASGTLLGAMFGRYLGGAADGADSGLGCGAIFGTAMWVTGGLVALPLSLGMPPLAPATLPGLWPLAMGTFIADLFYGLTLGITFGWLRQELRALPRGHARPRPA